MEHFIPVDKVTLTPVGTDTCGASGSTVTLLVGQEPQTGSCGKKMICTGLKFRTPCNSCHAGLFRMPKDTALALLEMWSAGGKPGHLASLWLPRTSAFACLSFVVELLLPKIPFSLS